MEYGEGGGGENLRNERLRLSGDRVTRLAPPLPSRSLKRLNVIRSAGASAKLILYPYPAHRRCCPRRSPLGWSLAPLLLSREDHFVSLRCLPSKVIRRLSLCRSRFALPPQLRLAFKCVPRRAYHLVPCTTLPESHRPLQAIPHPSCRIQEPHCQFPLLDRPPKLRRRRLLSPEMRSHILHTSPISIPVASGPPRRLSRGAFPFCKPTRSSLKGTVSSSTLRASRPSPPLLTSNDSRGLTFTASCIGFPARILTLCPAPRRSSQRTPLLTVCSAALSR